jgi:hypothetical protein
MNLKNTIISLLTSAITILAFTVTSNAQDKPVRYLFQNNGNISVSGFGGPMVGFSTVMDEFAVTTAGGGAALFNQQFFIGGYGEGLATEHSIRDINIYNRSSQTNHYYDKMQLTFGHGGMWLGYIHNYHKLVHWGASAKVGVGGIGLTYPGFTIDKHEMLMTDVVFVLTPQIELEVNLFPWMKMNFGVGYRLVSGVDKTYDFLQTNGEIVAQDFFKSNDFNSPSFTIGVLFGAFDLINGN